jgi:hypothetical protein
MITTLMDCPFSAPEMLYAEVAVGIGYEAGVLADVENDNLHRQAASAATREQMN